MAQKYIDKDFKKSTTSLDGSSMLNGQEIRDEKGHKMGKVLGSQYNLGTAMIDMQRLYKNGPDAKYFIEDNQVVIWQAPWIKLIGD